MKHLAILAVLALTSTPLHAADSWRNPPAAGDTAEPRGAISPNSFFEVPASRRATAEASLAGLPVVLLEEGAVHSISGGHFRCTYPEKPYLVRALYENPSTGRFDLERLGDSLWVGHNSLGPASGVHRSAIIVCLDFHPRRVFVSTSGAL